MSRSLILSEHFTDSVPAVANALQEHREDRAMLLASLTASLQSDPRVRAAWLWGSFGRNEADDLSDLDPWIIVADEAAAGFGPSIRFYAEQTGSFVTGGEVPQNAPPSGGYFGSLHEGRHGLLHLDCYWQPQSAMTTMPEHAVLFDWRNEPVSQPIPLRAIPAVIAASAREQIERDLGFAWLMFSIVAKYLARDPASDMELMFYPKEGLERAIMLLGQDKLLLPLDWSVPDEPLEKVARLRSLAEKTGQATAFASIQGLSLPLQYAPCLSHYLDLVAGILKDTRNFSV